MIKLTGSPQSLCRIIPSEIEDIIWMAMAAIPENTPDARVLVVDANPQPRTIELRKPDGSIVVRQLDGFAGVIS